MLVVVEDGDIAPLLQPALDLKAPGGGDILQIHTAKGPRQQSHGVHNLIHILGSHTQRQGVHPAECLEEHALALHHRHPRLRADIPQAQHRRAVGDHRHCVPPARELVAFIDILLNLQAGPGHPGRVGQGEGLPVLDLHFGHSVQLAPPLVVQF